MLKHCGLIAFLFSYQTSFSQLTADFSANDSSGCVPLVVTFNDLSTGSGIIYREWIFGYGGNGSNNNNPSPTAAYPVAGAYTVTLIVSNGVDTASVTKPNFINVFAKPDPNFTFTPQGGCAPVEVSFTNTSTAGSGSITSYQWDFDDGSGFSPQTNPAHNYSAAGVYTPTLKVTNSYGCHKTESAGTVNVSSGPNASFTSSAPQACTSPHTVNYTNTSTGIGPMTYQWDLGVNTSTSHSPSATYIAMGLHNVALTVTDAYGCQDEIELVDYAGIADLVADFEVEPPVCKGQPINLVNNSVGASTFSWSWGDNTQGSGMSPNKVYNAGGTYTIVLTATSGNCSDTATQTLQVQAISPSFTVSDQYGCEFPFVATYTNTSSVNFGTIDSVGWKLGQRLTGGGPYFGALQSGSPLSFERHHAGTYNDTIVVYTEEGCAASFAVQGSVVLEELIADYEVFPDRGCAPQQVTFTDESVPTPSYPITSWYYDFDNGNTANSATGITTYLDTGCYFPMLAIENAFGCKDTFVGSLPAEIVCFGAPQQAALAPWPDTVCAGDTTGYQDDSFDQQYIDEYIWMFGTPPIFFGGISDDPFHSQFFFDTGWVDLIYLVGQHGCYDTMAINNFTYVEGPVATFESTFSCDTPMVRNFHSDMLEVHRFYWDFGDNSPIDSINPNPQHTYAQSGEYLVTLKAYNDSTACYYEWREWQRVFLLAPDFTIDNFGSLPIDSLACAPSPFMFDASTTVDGIGQSLWMIDGDTVSNGQNTMFNNFAESGTYNITMVTWDSNGCNGTMSKNVHISKAVSNFGWEFLPGCDPIKINFLDSSTSDTNIVSWQWYLGDASGIHYEQNPEHEYAAAGTYVIRLTVHDSIGCSSTKQKLLSLSLPYVAFNVDTTICQFSAVNIVNASNGDGLSYTWDFDNGNNSTEVSPTTVYTDTGEFFIRLVLLDSQGCVDTAIQRVHVQNRPMPNFSADNTESPCLPLQTIFTDHSLSKHVVSRKWSFGDGSVSALLDTTVAFHTYTQAGTFNVKLDVETSYGCKGTQTRPNYIEVNGPYATFDISPDSVCKGEPIAFFVKDQKNMFQYRWVFGDGFDTLVSASTDTIYHAYSDTVGMRTPVVIYYDSGKVCDIPIIDSVFVHEVYARYSYFPDSIGCGALNLNLKNKSRGEDEYFWDFGDGRTSTKNDPLIYYPLPGVYEVLLAVENNEFGCSDSMMVPFVVFPKPEIEAFGDTIICLEETAEVFAETSVVGVSWSWLPSELADSPASQRTLVRPLNSTYFKVKATDTNGCEAFDSVRIVVQDTPVINIFQDTVVVIGESFPILVTTDDSLTYNWSPPYAFDCSTCKNPVFKAESSDWYHVLVSDVYGCFTKEFTFRVDVEEKYSADVPDGFTPNGDGVNDEIYLRGWGIEEVLEFRIFNRWGQEVFFSDDLSRGWDGTYRSKEQAMDTYAYVARVKFYDGNEKTLNGFIELIR